MTLRQRLPSSLASLLAAAVLTGASAVAANEQCGESSKSAGKSSESAKSDTAPTPPVDDSGNVTPAEPTPAPPPPGTAPNITPPARDATKPSRPSKQRPAWPPPPELIA